MSVLRGRTSPPGGSHAATSACRPRARLTYRYGSWPPCVCDFGCAMWALLDCRGPEGRIWFMDQGAVHRLDVSLAQWFESWLSGRLDMHLLRDARAT
jgi:hypothetical protein